MAWAADVKPGQVLKITKMVSDHGGELALGDDHVAWGIVLDDANMMVFTEVDQSGFYRGSADRHGAVVVPSYPQQQSDDQVHGVSATR
jgi:hypothetical protein